MFVLAILSKCRQSVSSRAFSVKKKRLSKNNHSVSQTLVTFLALFAPIALAASPITVEGSEFINTVTKDRFEIIGVAYLALILAKWQRSTTKLTILLATNLGDPQALLLALGLTR